MATWVLVPCLDTLRSDLNNVAPRRDKTSDGTIGDTAHQERSSDHNDDEVGNVPIRDLDSKHEIHAVDLDVDLHEPRLSMEMVVQHVVARCRSGAEKRLRYVIYNRRIWEASNGWRERAYTGDNPHDKHAHFSASYDTKHEADTSPWGLTDLVEDDVTKTEFMAWMTEWAKSGTGRDALARAVLTADGILPGPPGSLNADGTPNTHWAAGSYLQWGYRHAEDARAFSDAAVKAIGVLAGKDHVDEQALAAALAPLVAQAVLVSLPADRDDMTAAEMQQALEGVLRKLVSPNP